MAMEFRLLGDVDVRMDGRPVDVGHTRQRCVLAALLVDANQAVPVDQLVERVWAHRVPQRARGTVYTYVARLRRALSVVDDTVGPARRPGGYVLTVDPMAVDLHRFGALLVRARAASDETSTPAGIRTAARRVRPVRPRSHGAGHPRHRRRGASFYFTAHPDLDIEHYITQATQLFDKATAP
jgi:DNA-binding SARP family transcriptional activator